MEYVDKGREMGKEYGEVGAEGKERWGRGQREEEEGKRTRERRKYMSVERPEGERWEGG